MDRRFGVNLLIGGLVVFAFGPAVYAQLSSGAVLGTVTDTSGAVIPGVGITITNTGTHLVRETVTNESGNYRVDLLPVGDYQIEANLPGFRKEVRNGINVSIDARLRVDFSLAVGDVSEVVNVEGQAPLVQTDSSGVGVVVDEQKIVGLPLNGRNFSQLAYIVPGAYAPRPNSQIGYRGGFQIAGGHEAENQFLLDGINNNGNWTSEVSARVNVDAVAEFKIQTDNYSAQYGRYSGAQVDAITKSGTNQFHGDAFWFHRDNFLRSRNFFDPFPETTLPGFKRQQYGGTLGGPIIKDRTFFFAAFQGQRLASFLTVAANDPPAQFWNGDLSQAGVTIKDPSTGQSFQGNIIPPNRISPIALGLQQFWPTPTRSGLVNNYTSYLPQPDNYWQGTLHLDHQMTPRQKIAFVENYYSENLLEDYSSGGSFGTPTFGDFLGNSSINSFNVSVGHTFTISPTIVNEFRIGASHLHRGRYFLPVQTSQNWRAVLGIDCCTQGDVNPNSYGVPLIGINNFSPIGGPNAFPQPRGDTNFTIFDTVAIQLGNHSVKFGGDFFRMGNNSIQSNNATGTFSFNGYATGYAFADFLLGLPSQAQRQISLGLGTSNSRRNSTDLFLQDDWKVNSKLTLNIGLREEAN
jgi:outer membrane receptor protein involved in Fe transport